MQLAGHGGASPLASGTTCKTPSLFPFAKHRAWFPVRTSLLLAEVSRAMMGCDLGQREEGGPGSVSSVPAEDTLLSPRAPWLAHLPFPFPLRSNL